MDVVAAAVFDAVEGNGDFRHFDLLSFIGRSGAVSSAWIGYRLFPFIQMPAQRFE
jgi:hypothetical protein